MNHFNVVFHAGCALVLLASCTSKHSDVSDDLAAIQKNGKLVVLTRNAATTYFEDRDEEIAGLEYELTRAFAEELGVTAEYVVEESANDTLTALARHQGHLVAAGITRTPKRAETFIFGTDYQTVQEEVVCGPNIRTENLKVPADLQRVRLLVTADTSYDERLKDLAQSEPDLHWETTTELSTEQLLQKVGNGEVDCTVADSNVLAVQQRYFLRIKKAFPLGAEESLAWVMNPDQPALQAAVNQFFEKIKADGKLDALLDSHYSFLEDFDPYDIKIFSQRIGNRLPKYRIHFEAAGKKYRLPWDLLAAVAYQESQWDPGAESKTGVEGMMMLTKNTAASLGVLNRLDAKQSIFGGARYLRELIDKMPGHMDEDARLWMGLASYNVGYYHLRDARSLSVLLDKNPAAWSDVKDVLPLLTQQKYYRRLTHGYARGYEAADYVKRIRNYMDLLSKESATNAAVPPRSRRK